MAALFEVDYNDSVWDAWLTTVNLMDIVERSQQARQSYNFEESRHQIEKICQVAEEHRIDKNERECCCGLSSAEHLLLKRKILKFYMLQVSSLKHFL
jgi:hypothetical protein